MPPNTNTNDQQHRRTQNSKHDKWAQDFQRRVRLAAEVPAVYERSPRYVREAADQLHARGGEA
ncbi:hypothetical protein [Mycobacterium conspicuum]|uniref:Uncharacterized protein n=1 Tax=Mycobacterium conspicuum TaxID=44010 RepID=A0A7I7YA44_9MYCO|nr:hypothetical protein [Mycobacterium conspicuum]BBZ38579.1 hypothetical protein MCNS_16420 [Mycobacterium conspicuum]